jgi:hypothetical protein
VLRGDKEVGTESHRLPRDHEEVGIVGEDDHGHGSEEDVVLQPHKAGGSALAGAEVARGKDGDAAACKTKQQEEECGKSIETKVEGQVGQTQREDDGLRCLRGNQECAGEDSNGETDRRTDGKEHARSKTAASRPRQACDAEEYPDGRQQQHKAQLVSGYARDQSGD